MMPQTSDRLRKLQQQKAAIEAKLRHEQQKIKTQERKADARRKILVGALVMKAAETDAQLREKINTLVQSLKRDDERALFDLPPLQKTETENQDTQGAIGKENPAPAPANQDRPEVKTSFMDRITGHKS